MSRRFGKMVSAVMFNGAVLAGTTASALPPMPLATSKATVPYACESLDAPFAAMQYNAAEEALDVLRDQKLIGSWKVLERKYSRTATTDSRSYDFYNFQIQVDVPKVANQKFAAGAGAQTFTKCDFAANSQTFKGLSSEEATSICASLESDLSVSKPTSAVTALQGLTPVGFYDSTKDVSGALVLDGKFKGKSSTVSGYSSTALSTYGETTKSVEWGYGDAGLSWPPLFLVGLDPNTSGAWDPGFFWVEFTSDPLMETTLKWDAMTATKTRSLTIEDVDVDGDGQANDPDDYELRFYLPGLAVDAVKVKNTATVCGWDEEANEWGIWGVLGSDDNWDRCDELQPELVNTVTSSLMDAFEGTVDENGDTGVKKLSDGVRQAISAIILAEGAGGLKLYPNYAYIKNDLITWSAIATDNKTTFTLKFEAASCPDFVPPMCEGNVASGDADYDGLCNDIDVCNGSSPSGYDPSGDACHEESTDCSTTSCSVRECCSDNGQSCCTPWTREYK